MDKEFIYFPSFSVGALSHVMSKNIELKNVHSRFYSKELPKEYRHPYILLTAGHNFKKKNIRKDWGLDEEDILVMGDSGGYQIATGALEWSNKIRDKIFHWLENNSDVALNIDIPTNYNMSTRGHFESFNECLEVSYDNFKYFNEKQTGKTKFLNVLHGNNDNQSQIWYDKMKGFDFNGWALGGSGEFEILMLKMAVLRKNNELSNKRNQYIHVLGTSKIFDVFILSQLQKTLNEMYDNRIQLSTDSSSPALTAAFGNYYLYPNYKKGSFKKVNFSNQADDYNLEAPLPCNCVVCQNVKYKDIIDFNSEAYSTIILHNLFKLTDTIKFANKTIQSNKSILEQIFDNDFIKILDSIPKILKDKDPVKRYKQYLPLYKKQLKIDTSSFSDFFDGN